MKARVDNGSSRHPTGVRKRARPARGAVRCNLEGFSKTGKQRLNRSAGISCTRTQRPRARPPPGACFGIAENVRCLPDFALDEGLTHTLSTYTKPLFS